MYDIGPRVNMAHSVVLLGIMLYHIVLIYLMKKTDEKMEDTQEQEVEPGDNINE